MDASKIEGIYLVTCRDKDGNIVWTDQIENLITTVGKNNILDTYLEGSSYTATWYLGLIGATGYTTGVAAGDTAASHGGWAENTSYSQATRPAAVFDDAAAGVKALTSALAFSINASTTIKGCFLISNNTKGGTTGILLSAGLFNTDKVADNGYQIDVSYSLSLT